MWDSRGTKAVAIKDKIIANDVVPDNVGVEDKKIDTASLVKEINDGTGVIKSSHISVGGANRSLLVVYNAITGDVSTLSTALSVEQGKISPLITDVSQAKGDVLTLQTSYDSLTRTVNGINSAISSHSTSIENLSSMEIGGRNLTLNIRPDKVTPHNVTNRQTGEVVDEATTTNGKAMQITCTQARAQGFYIMELQRSAPGKKYAQNVYIKASKNVNIGSAESEQYGQRTCSVTNAWQRFKHTFTANNDARYVFIFCSSPLWAVGDIVQHHSLILIEGDKAPTWVPTPEDVDTSIKTISDKISTLEQTINGFSDRISSVEITTDNASSKVTEITATVDRLTTTVTSKTDKGAITSTTDQSAEAIKIQASKPKFTRCVTAANLPTNGQTAIDGENIETRTITAVRITSGSITAAQIAGSTITAAKAASGTITATQITANTITGAKIAFKTTTADKTSVTSLSALTASLGTVTAGNPTFNTTISVSASLIAGNNIYLNQNVNTTKYIYFDPSNYIRDLYTDSYNYITLNSNYRCALMSGSTSVYTFDNMGEAGISANGNVVLQGGNAGGVEHYGKYYNSNWSSGQFRSRQPGTVLGSGGASYRWYRLYTANTCSTSSDIRLKIDVKKHNV